MERGEGGEGSGVKGGEGVVGSEWRGVGGCEY